MTTITRSTFYALARYARTHGEVEYDTCGTGLHAYYYTPTFWVSVYRTEVSTHYMVIYRPTHEYIYNVMDYKK